LEQVIRKESVDLIFPNTDADVEIVSRLSEVLSCRVFLPRESVVELCMDKYRLGMFLRGRGLPAPETYPIDDAERLEEVWGQFDRPAKLWCRMRAGSGSMGALPVATLAQVKAWIEYWQDMRGIPPGFSHSLNIFPVAISRVKACGRMGGWSSSRQWSASPTSAAPQGGVGHGWRLRAETTDSGKRPRGRGAQAHRARAEAEGA
jgi:hypothetical protein